LPLSNDQAFTDGAEQMWVMDLFKVLSPTQ